MRNPINQTFASYLEKEATYHSANIKPSKMLAYYDEQLAKGEDAESAFRYVMERFGRNGENVNCIVAAISEALDNHAKQNTPAESIETQLTRFMKSNSIDVNPISRIATQTARHNRWIKSLALEGITDAENEKFQDKALRTIPECFLPKQEPTLKKYEASATHKTKGSVRLEMDVFM